jgi:hypothetical protein
MSHCSSDVGRNDKGECGRVEEGWDMNKRRSG